MSSYSTACYILLTMSLLNIVVSEKCDRKYHYINAKNKCPFSIPENGTLLDYGVCIRHSYDSSVSPKSHGTIENTTKEEIRSRGAKCFKKCDECCMLTYTPVFTTINYHMVRDVDDKKRTMTSDISLTMFWMDDRIKTYRDVTVDKDHAKLRSIDLPISRKTNIWTPDLYVYNLSEYKSFKDSINVVGLKILALHYQDNGFCLQGPMVKYDIEAKINFYCDLDYSQYPMDFSTCKLRLGSQRSDTRFILHDDQSYRFNNEQYRVLNFEIKAAIVEELKKFSMEKIGLDIKINRVIQPFVLKYYLPCIIITLVSQCSFIIPLTAIPGRISLIITSLLTIISIFLQQMVCVYMTY